MNLHILPSACLFLLAISLSLPVLADEAAAPKASSELLPPMSAKELKQLSSDLLPESLKPKMTVLDATVSVDGVLRPDLGVAFSDTIAARLLKTDDFEILDSSSAGQVGQILPPGTDLTKLTTPGPSVAVEVGKAIGADFVIVPTIIGNEGEFRLTMRKLRVPGGKIEEIIQETFRGSVKTVFATVDQIATRLLPKKKEENAPITYVKVWMAPTPAVAPPKPVEPLAKEIAAAPKAIRSSVAPARQEPVRLGRLEAVDLQWSFCEISCPAGVAVHPKQQIFACSGGDLSNLIALTVNRIEGGRIIADLTRGEARNTLLRAGDAVYRWAAPPSTPAAAARP